MLSFETTLGDLYVAKLEYYNILIRPSVLEVYIKTNQGDVQYVLTSGHGVEISLVSMREAIAEELNKDHCRIKEDEKNKIIYFDRGGFNGIREVSSFLPN